MKRHTPNRHNEVLDTPQLLCKSTRLPVILWASDRGLDFFATSNPAHYEQRERCVEVLMPRRHKVFKTNPPTGYYMLTDNARYDCCLVEVGRKTTEVWYINDVGDRKYDVVDNRNIVCLRKVV